MSKKLKILAFLSIGVIISIGKYTIVIGQTNGVLVALNKAEASMAIIDPATMKVTAKVAVGNGPHEVVLSPDGKTAYVANYGDGPNPGNSISVIDIATATSTPGIVISRRVSWQPSATLASSASINPSSWLARMEYP